jgi:hypothetical protein
MISAFAAHSPHGKAFSDGTKASIICTTPWRRGEIIMTNFPWLTRHVSDYEKA